MCTHLAQDSRPILDSSQAVVLNLLDPSWSYHLSASPAVIQKHREGIPLQGTEVREEQVPPRSWLWPT